MDEFCIICQKKTDSIGTSFLGEKGLHTLEKFSDERNDGLREIWCTLPKPLRVHISCRKDYTRPYTSTNKKRKPDCDSDDTPTKSIRSKAVPFNIKEDCLYCASVIRRNKYKRTDLTWSNIETLEYVKNVQKKAEERDDSWGNEVKCRILTSFDLVAAEGKYHRQCAQRFYMGRHQDDTSSSSVGRPSDTVKSGAFEKLCGYINESDECQYSNDEILSLYEGLCDNEKIYTAKHLDQKLREHFGDEIIVTKVQGKPRIYSFRDRCHRILRENWEKDTKASSTQDDIIDMAASIIRDEIRTKVYDTSMYPDMQSLESSVPDVLSRLLRGIIKSKGDANSTAERRCKAISHAIIAACRPRSFISPILLSIAVYIHRKYGSRELIDILSSLSFADDYKEVQRLTTAVLQSSTPEYDLGNFTQFVFDNADFNISTLTGHGTFHAMGGIACVTPPCASEYPILQRPKDSPSSEVTGMFSQLDIRQYRKPVEIRPTVIKKLFPHDNPDIPNLHLCKALNVLWQCSFTLGLQPSECPFWSGFMQIVNSNVKYAKSQIIILPFINHDPNNLSTIYTALCFAEKLIDQYGLGVFPVTFDQPLYAKAREIVESSTDIRKLFVRLGGFHLLMSYQGSIGYVMSGSGLENLWETVYAPNTVAHMLTGHAYARALRAHLLSSAAVLSLLLDRPGAMNGVDLDQLREIHQALLCATSAPSDVHADMMNIHRSVTGALLELAGESRTGKLWVKYVEYVNVIQMFLHAERIGDWNLHIYCIRHMIPLFHAAGHLAYAKSARLYVQDMERLADHMSHSEYEDFTKKGYFTIRRKDQSWGGNFSDQVIEQELMRQLKTSGGMTHGRGITESTLTKWIHSLPYHVLVCDALESFTGIQSWSSEQHKDLRISTATKDTRDYSVFSQWLYEHSPFSYTDYDSIVSIATGLVADKQVNCDDAYSIGFKAASRIDGQLSKDVKLNRKDKVLTISGSANTIKVRGQEAIVNPALLFMRITCVMKDSSDMEDYLTYELAQQPPSLFDKGFMRKTNKSVLATHLRSHVTISSEIPSHSIFVLDGGYLLHTIQWPQDATYQQVCNAYVKYVTDHYPNDCIIVFDGYRGLSTKSSEQQRRATQQTSADILFERNMKVTCNANAFLHNKNNKARLIEFISEDLQSNQFTVKQHSGDADSLIVSTALSTEDERKQPVVVVANDTDILVMLVCLSRSNGNIHLLHSPNPIQLINIQEVQSANAGVSDHLLFLHSMTGCDTTSALYMKGKTKAFDVMKSLRNSQIPDAFTSPTSTHDDVAQNGEDFLLQLYGGGDAKTLDQKRYIMYKRSISKSSLSSVFKLETLPPTSAAAKYHSYRVYHTVQQWIGNELSPLDWGWRVSASGLLVPIETDKPVAPDKILRMISCGCKTGCGQSCGCRKKGLHCSVMCSQCYGLTCSNISIDV